MGLVEIEDDRENNFLATHARSLPGGNTLSIIELFAHCKGGNFNIHIWLWFGYFIC